MLLTKSILRRLIDNGLAQQRVKGTCKEIDHIPVVKLFDPVGAATWILTEIDPDDHDIAWGLCDLGVRCPAFGTVSLAELASIKGPLGLGIERDLYWRPRGPISAYINAAAKVGRVVQLPHCPQPVSGFQKTYSSAY